MGSRDLNEYNETVSIIMPAYNVEQFISEAIDSVLLQTYENWELIIVNDCSVDKTADVVASYLVDKRVKLVNNSVNLGGAGSRNKAIELAKGRYIAFLDADDLWASNKLQKQLLFMKDKEAGFVFSGYNIITEFGEIRGSIEVPSSINFNRLLKHNYIGCLTAIYDTKPYGKVLMPLVYKRQDFALWLELLKKFDHAFGLNESLGFYRVRSGSLSSNKKDAFKYYWLVLRKVGQCNVLSSAYNICCYLFIVFLKKNNVKLYHKLFVK